MYDFGRNSVDDGCLMMAQDKNDDFPGTDNIVGIYVCLPSLSLSVFYLNSGTRRPEIMTTEKCEFPPSRAWSQCFHFPQTILTTMRFHIFAASATVVQTVLHPASSISFCGLLYKRLYMTLAPRPGSHCKQTIEHTGSITGQKK